MRVCLVALMARVLSGLALRQRARCVRKTFSSSFFVLHWARCVVLEVRAGRTTVSCYFSAIVTLLSRVQTIQRASVSSGLRLRGSQRRAVFWTGHVVGGRHLKTLQEDRRTAADG